MHIFDFIDENTVYMNRNKNIKIYSYNVFRERLQICRYSAEELFNYR